MAHRKVLTILVSIFSTKWVAHEEKFAMHRVLNIKHRIVRRIDVGKAPLATFDIVDLGDGDTCTTVDKDSENNKIRSTTAGTRPIKPRAFIYPASQQSETIGGNNSKKSLSQAGGGKDEKKGEEAPGIAGDGKENPDETGTTPSSKCTLQTLSPSPEKETQKEKDRELVSRKTPSPEVINKDKDNKEEGDAELSAVKDSSAHSSATLTRQGTLGRVSIPIRKQDSVSSSSSSEACSDAHFTFSATRPSIAHLDSADAGPNLPDSARDKDSVSNLIPEIIDPSQILSPSKRKAYEKRIERLKVTTSPIARPRSTAPISVVTLEEYANLSSPEASPASPSVLQDKLKITLPSDEFSSKPRTPRHLSAKKHDSEETCFEFTEEILFRCTKSALVVEEDGHLPLSPRRVLIPPTITPATSPKLSESPRLSKDNGTEEVAALSTTPKLIYFREDVNAQTFFGKTIDQTEDENWADFPDSRSNFEKGDKEGSAEKEVNSLNVSHPSKEIVPTEQLPGVFVSCEDLPEKQDLQDVKDVQPSDTVQEFLHDCAIPIYGDSSEPLADDSQKENVETSYNIKENSEDVLVVEIVQRGSNSDEESTKVNVIDQDSRQEFIPEKQNSNLPDQAHSSYTDNTTWAFFDNPSQIGEPLSDSFKEPTKNGAPLGQSSIHLLDLKQTTAETDTQPFPDATTLLDTSAASLGDSGVESALWLPPDTSIANSCISPSEAAPSLNKPDLFPIDSTFLEPDQRFAVSLFEPACEEHEQPPGHLTLTPVGLEDSHLSSPSDLMSFSSSQDADDTIQEQQ